MSKADYSVKVVDCSREMTAKERISFKDTSDCIRIDSYTKEHGELIINPVDYVELAIHNEKGEDKDYNSYIIIDKDGTKYLSGSKNLFDTFRDIWDDMAGEDEEWALKCYRLPSKNYQGRDFITCSII